MSGTAFQRHIGAFQAIQLDLADIETAGGVGAVLCYNAYRPSTRSARANGLSAMAKRATPWRRATKAIALAMRVHGAMGLSVAWSGADGRDGALFDPRRHSVSWP